MQNATTGKDVQGHEPIQIVTVPEAASRLSVSPRTIWTMLANGTLRRMKIRRRTGVSLADIRRFINEQGGQG